MKSALLTLSRPSPRPYGQRGQHSRQLPPLEKASADAWHCHGGSSPVPLLARSPASGAFLAAARAGQRLQALLHSMVAWRDLPAPLLDLFLQVSKGRISSNDRPNGELVNACKRHAAVLVPSSLPLKGDL